MPEPIGSDDHRVAAFVAQEGECYRATAVVGGQVVGGDRLVSAADAREIITTALPHLLETIQQDEEVINALAEYRDACRGLVHVDPELLTHCVALAHALSAEGVEVHPGAVRAALRRLIDG